MVIGMNMFVQKCSKIQATGYFSRKSSIFVLKISTDLLDLFHQDYYQVKKLGRNPSQQEIHHIAADVTYCHGEAHHLKWIYNRIKATSIIQGYNPRHMCRLESRSPRNQTKVFFEQKLSFHSSLAITLVGFGMNKNHHP